MVMIVMMLMILTTMVMITMTMMVMMMLQEYMLTYRVFDDKFTNTTHVRVQVLDVNDNPPLFDNNIYNVTDIMEEEPGISKNNPKYLLSVSRILSMAKNR